MSEEPRREIILTRSHIRLGRRVRINKDFPSRASSWTGEYFKHPSTLPLLLATHSVSLSITLPGSRIIHLPSSSLFVALFSFSSTLTGPPLIRIFIISARETFFIDYLGTRGLSDTGCKLFLPFLPYTREDFFISSSSIRCPFFPRSVAPSFVRSFACTLSTSFSPTCRASMNT